MRIMSYFNYCMFLNNCLNIENSQNIWGSEIKNYADVIKGGILMLTHADTGGGQGSKNAKFVLCNM